VARFQVPARQTVRACGSPAHRLPAFFTVGVQPARAGPGRPGRGDDGDRLGPGAVTGYQAADKQRNALLAQSADQECLL